MNRLEKFYYFENTLEQLAILPEITLTESLALLFQVQVNPQESIPNRTMITINTAKKSCVSEVNQ